MTQPLSDGLSQSDRNGSESEARPLPDDSTRVAVPEPTHPAMAAVSPGQDEGPEPVLEPHNPLPSHSVRSQPEPPPEPSRPLHRLKTQAILWSAAIATLSALGVGWGVASVANRTFQAPSNPSPSPGLVVPSPQVQLRYWVLGGALGSGVLAGVLAAMLLPPVLRPLISATKTLQALKEGDLEARTAATGQDEWVQLGSAVNQVAEFVTELTQSQAIALEQLRQESQATLNQARASQRRAENWAEEQRHQREALHRRIQSLRQAIAPLEQGDWSAQVPVTDGDLGAIAAFINRLVTQLNHLIDQVQKTTTHIMGVLGDSTPSTQSLANAAAHQAPSVATALDQLQGVASTLQAIVEQIQQTQTAAELIQSSAAEKNDLYRALERIIASQQAFDQLTQQLHPLEATSHSLLQTGHQLNELTGQMMLLAFNTALASARLGDDGRGIAASTQQWQSLVQQTATLLEELTPPLAHFHREVSQMQGTMALQVEDITVPIQAMQQVGQDLNRMSDISTSLVAQLEAIASTTAQQSQETETLIPVLQQLATLVHQTSTQSSQSFATAQHLIASAQDLQSALPEQSTESSTRSSAS